PGGASRGQPAGAGLLRQADEPLRPEPLGFGRVRALDPGRRAQFPGEQEHARPDRRGGDVADIPLPRARSRGGAAVSADQKKTSHGLLIKTSATQAKFSRRAILKRLGIGAGFLPLLSTARARAAANGFPTRFLSITWTDGICPPNFYPSGSAGPFSANLPSILSPLQPWSSKLIAFRHASKVQSPLDINVMIDVGSKYGGHFTYPAMLT